MHDHIVPNFSAQGAIFESVEKVRYFGRPGLTRWAVPIDDTNTMVIAWRHFNDRDDPYRQGRPEDVGLEKTDFYGQSRHRPEEMRKRNPGDYDAWTSLGPITSHEREHLATTDKGIALLRHKLRREIRELREGEEPVRPVPGSGGHVPTYGGDTILHVPAHRRRRQRADPRSVAQGQGGRTSNSRICPTRPDATRSRGGWRRSTWAIRRRSTPTTARCSSSRPSSGQTPGNGRKLRLKLRGTTRP